MASQAQTPPLVMHNITECDLIVYIYTSNAVCEPTTTITNILPSGASSGVTLPLGSTFIIGAEVYRHRLHAIPAQVAAFKILLLLTMEIAVLSP